jgi:hypothetical protein
METPMGKRGPKPGVGKFAKKGATLGARITIRTRERLETAAKASGRSLSEETEVRLARSLGEETEYQLFQVAMAAVRGTEAFTGQSWLSDAYTFDAMVSVVADLIGHFRPHGQARMPETLQPLRGLAQAPAQLKREMTEKLASVRPSEWAHVIAGGIVISLQQRGFGRIPAEREVFKKAAEYLDGLLTDSPLKPIIIEEKSS